MPLFLEIYLAGVIGYILVGGFALGVIKDSYVKSWPLFFVSTAAWPIFLLIGIGGILGRIFRR